jgi:hypothetical protein
LVPAILSASLTAAPNEPLKRRPVPPASAGSGDRNCTLPPIASLPYCALFGPRSTSIDCRLVGSTRSRKVFTPPRAAAVE